MDSLPAILSIDSSCDETLKSVKQSFERGGLRVLETFDLQTARLGLADCPCPYHGMEACDCQMVVLLVYGEATAPMALTLHGNDGQTWISLANEGAGEPGAALHAAVELALRGIPGGQGL